MVPRQEALRTFLVSEPPTAYTGPGENESDVILFPGQSAPERQQSRHLAMLHFHVKGRQGLTEAGAPSVLESFVCTASLGGILTMHPTPGRVSSQAEASEQEGLAGTRRAGLSDSGLSAAPGTPASPRTRPGTTAGAWSPQFGQLVS